MIFIFNEQLFQAPARRFQFFCNATTTTASNGFWFGNTVDYPFPLLLLQITVLFASARATHHVLKPFSIPSHISYILGGVLVGPSGLGELIQIGKGDPLRPLGIYGEIMSDTNKVPLTTISLLADLFYSLVIGVKTDIGMIQRAGKKAFAIAFFSCAIPMISAAIVLKSFSSEFQNFKSYGLPIAFRLSINSFIVLSVQLSELQMLTSKLGRLALSSALIVSLGSSAVQFVMLLGNMYVNDLGSVKVALAVAAMLATAMVFRYGVYLFAKSVARRTPKGKDLDKPQFLSVLVLAMMMMVVSDLMGFYPGIGPLIMGLFIPGGPPIGSTLVRRLEGFIAGVLVPVFLAQAGSRTDFFGILMVKDDVLVMLYMLLIMVGKFVGVLLPCLYCKIPARDAFFIGLMLNARGISETSAFQYWLDAKAFSVEVYTTILLSTVGIAWGTAFVFQKMYKPSLRYLSYRQRTIEHKRPGDSLRVLACIHKAEDAPLLASLLGAFHPEGDGEIHTYLLQLVPLMGHAAAVLAPLWRDGIHKTPESSHIMAVFTNLQHRHTRRVVAVPYISMAPYATMHDDVCTMAFDKKSVVVLLPFYGSNTAQRTTCIQVLSYAPCSVGIIIDHGYIDDNKFHSIAVIFFGSADDREALALATRMSEAPRAFVTVFHFQLDDQWQGRTYDQTLDNEALSLFREKTMGNKQVLYKEEMAADAPSLISAIREITNQFGLLIVGRRKGKKSQIDKALEEWSEYSELGVLGDMLASDDFKGKASTLVIQQQVTVAGKDSL